MTRLLLLALPLVACNKLECPEYSGLHAAGDEWDWQHTAAWSEANGGTTGTWTVTLEAVDLNEAGDTIDVVATAVGVDETPDLAQTRWSTDVRFQCDATGLWLTAASWTGEIATPVGTFPVTLLKELTKADLVMTADLAPGATWTSDVEGTTTDPENGEQPYAEAIVRTAADAPGTVVPAGTFDALTVTAEGDTSGTTYSTLAVGIGNVTDDVGELVLHRPFLED